MDANVFTRLRDALNEVTNCITDLQTENPKNTQLIFQCQTLILKIERLISKMQKEREKDALNRVCPQ